jgi:hypothetical protein
MIGLLYRQGRAERVMEVLRDYGLFVRTALVVGALFAGCSTPGKVPMQVNIVQLANYVHAARPPECDMPILDGLPLISYREVAIVEVWADIKDTKSDVLPALKRKACETGADALVIVNSQHQDIKNFLYKATPNENLNEVTQQDVYSGQGEYIKEAEHTHRIGEPGHNGLYVNAIAINYIVRQEPAVPTDSDTRRPSG